MSDFKIENLSESTLTLYENCFAINGSPKKRENIEWQFFENITQLYYVNIATDPQNNNVAGIYALSCVYFKLKSKIVRASQSLDTITDISYRGKGLFIQLAKSVYDQAFKDGVAIVYGFPNGNSIYGFQKKLEWQILDPVPFLIKPLKSKYFTDRISFLKFLPNISLSFSLFNSSKDYNLEFKNEFPKEVNTIWQNFSKNIQIAINRDKKYLDWRYISKPDEDYKIIHCTSSLGEYLGFIIYTVKGKHGGMVGYIMEFLFDLKDQKAGKLLLRKAISAIKQQNADCILSWCLDHSPNYNIFKAENFFKMPERLRPIELHFGARAFDGRIKDLVSKRENWYLSYSDSDTV